jgi:phosphopantothenoylcysteine decarboxylase/phosphopantothenate--cysteine ligase
MNVLFGITGGIAAYKAVSIIRLLSEQGHQVKVVPTQNALRFVGATTLEALSHNTVDSDLYTDVESVKHVALGQEADLVIVAPASAAFLARYATGLADDLLLNALLASNAKVVIAPAMHTEMWQNAATQANVATLRSRGVLVLEPATGRLTGEDIGKGRMPEPADIVSAALAHAANQASLAGKRVLISVGGTREQIDPVRYIGNHSSGKQGVALAYAAQAAGAEVTLIAANLEISATGLGNVISVNSALELQEALKRQMPAADVLIMAAAVSDFRVEHVNEQKIKRSELGSEVELRLIANPDILAELSERYEKVYKVAFAAETAGSLGRLSALAEIKLAAKNCDAIVANDVSEGAVFGSDTNQVYLLDRNGNSAEVAGTKQQVASAVIGFIAQRLG